MKKIILDDIRLPISEFLPDKNSKTFDVKTTLKELVIYFSTSNDQTACVVEDGKLAGIVSRNDVVYRLNNFFEEEDGGYIEEFMIKRPFVIRPDHTILDALIMIAKKEVSAIAVVDEQDQFIQLLDFNDFFEWILAKVDLEMKYEWKLDHWSYFDTNIMEVAFDTLEKGVIDERIFKFQCRHAIKDDVLRLDATDTVANMRDIFKKYRQPQCVITEFGTKTMGIISANEVIDFLIASDFKPDPNFPILDIMNQNMVEIMYKHTFKHGITLMKHKGLPRLLVVDEDNFPMSIMRTYDILKYITDALLSEKENLGVLNKVKIAV